MRQFHWVQRVLVWRGQFLRREMLESCARLACAVILLVAVLLWLDRAFILTAVARGIFLALAAAALGAAAARFAAGLLRFDEGVFLDELATVYPLLSRHLRPAWELRDATPEGVSAELITAHCKQTEELVRTLAPRPAFPWTPSFWVRRGALGAFLAALTLTGFDRDSWQRALAPWRDKSLESVLELAPGDAAVDWGRSVEIRARWRTAAALRASELRLELREKGPWRAREWDKTLRDGGSFAIAEIKAPLEYRVRLRDRITRVYRLTPHPPPELTGLTAAVTTLKGRAVAALLPETPLSVLRGSWVSITGKPNGPLAKSYLKLSGRNAAIAFKELSSGELRAGFQALEDGTFQFELESSDGRREAHPLTYSFKAALDKPPEIEWLSPHDALQASPRDTLPIAYAARDDVGLTLVHFIVRPPGAPEMRRPLEVFSDRPLEYIGDYSWELAGLPLGVPIQFQLMASDSARAPQSTLSTVLTVELVDFEAGHAAMEKLWLKSLKSLETMAAREEALVDKLSRREVAGLEDQLAALPEGWRQTSAELSSLAEAMGRDVYSNPGIERQTRALASELSRMGSQPLTSANAEARAGRWEEAQKQHGRLSRELRKAERLMREGLELQAYQDFHSQTARMTQAAAEIESALDRMAGAKPGTAPSGEDARRLSRALEKLHQQMAELAAAVASLPPPPAGGGAAKSRKIFTVPMGEAQEVASLLAKAIAEGDYAFAAKLADALSERLSAVQKTLGEAARAASSRPQAPGSERLEKAKALWEDVLAEQSRDLETTQRLEQKKLSKHLEEQKKLLEDLAREQAVLISSAAAAGPQGFPADVLADMRKVHNELSARRLRDSIGLLRGISTRLRGRWESFAQAEDRIRAALEQFPQDPPQGSPDHESQAASKNQSSTRKKTGELQNSLEEISRDVATLPAGALQRCESAQIQQGLAEESLTKGDTAGALRHQEEALSLLEKGMGEMGQAVSGQHGVEEGMGEPFGQAPGSVRERQGSGPSGTHTGPVPLPTAKDYRPPVEMREELERSLREKRPASHDRVIKEYFKRIAQ